MRRCFLACTLLLLPALGCVVGPDYKRPSAPVPTAYTEPLATGDRTEWKTVQPMDGIQRGKWWETFGDPELDALEDQVSVSNQNIAQAEAEWRGAQAAVRGTRAQYYPSVGTVPTVTRSSSPASGAAAASDGPHPTINSYELPVSFAWEIDLFGGIRRSVESSVASAQASAADLESARLSMHAQLATDYFLLRGLDEEKRLLDSSVEAYAKTVELTTNRYAQGIVSGIDVAQAQTQLKTTMAQSTDVAISRAQVEDAISILVGRPPGDFSLHSSESVPAPPAVPPQVPSDLLERRPDIAAAERRAAAANAQIGVATAAYYPTLTLAGTGGYQSSSLTDLFSLPSRFWSLGGAIAGTIIDGGKRRAATAQARASYDAEVAAYRETVLASFGEVEDNLSALHLLDDELTQQTDAVTAANRALAIAQDRYKAGVTSYLEVVTAQFAALNNEQAAVQIRTRQLTASVNLIKALGGGWSAADL